MDTLEIYSISAFASRNGQIKAVIAFNEKHPVFAGHFPGNPVVPGVLQVQVIKELLEKKLGQKLLLVSARNIKFLSVISPVVHPEVEAILHVGLSENQYMVQASIY
jgi:3-hydroxyacyl-[acyl-carrier-protein] dehydratase